MRGRPERYRSGRAWGKERSQRSEIGVQVLGDGFGNDRPPAPESGLSS